MIKNLLSSLCRSTLEYIYQFQKKIPKVILWKLNDEFECQSYNSYIVENKSMSKSLYTYLV